MQKLTQEVLFVPVQGSIQFSAPTAPSVSGLVRLVSQLSLQVTSPRIHTYRKIRFLFLRLDRRILQQFVVERRAAPSRRSHTLRLSWKARIVVLLRTHSACAIRRRAHDVRRFACIPCPVQEYNSPRYSRRDRSDLFDVVDSQF